MDKKSIRQGLNNIAKTDADIKRALKIYGYPEPRVQPAGFETLVNTIISQQLSSKAAQSIMQRVHDCLDEITPVCVLKKTFKQLKKSGIIRAQG